MKNLIVTVLALFTLVFQAQLPPAALADDARTELAVARYRIEGMVTDNCPVLVKAAVSRVEGVTRVTASLERKSAEVTYDAARTSPDAIRKVIKDKVGLDAVMVQ